MNNPIVMGIDLGTTFSAAAYVTEFGALEDLTNGKSIPSVVFINDGEIIVGTEAANRWLKDESHTVRWVKRAIGDPNWQFPRRLMFAFDPFPEVDIALRDPAEAKKRLAPPFGRQGISLSADVVIVPLIDRWVVREKDAAYVVILKGDSIEVHEGFSAIQISAEILKTIKNMTAGNLGQMSEDAVITCPAYFNANEAENTKKAGELAGFRVHEIIREPVAAAVCHGVDRLQEGRRILIGDLGGGTFDSTILQMVNGQFDPIATVGDRMLGGHDWTSELVDLACERFVTEGADDPKNDPETEHMLYEACENVKRAFGKLPEQAIACTIGGQLRQVTVTRAEFEDRSEYLISRMITTCENCLKKGNLSWHEIDSILMVGGSSRMPRVGAALEAAGGKKPELARTPDTMVVNGAAIMARGGVRTRAQSGGISLGRAGGITIVNPKRRTTRALGTRVYDRNQKRVVSALVMPHGEEAPAKRSREDLEVTVNKQEYFDIPVMEYEDKEFDENERLEPVANFRFYCLPQSKRGDRVKVTLGYDKSQIPFAEALDIGTGRPLRIERAEYKEPDPAQMVFAIKPRWVIFALDVSGSMSTHNKIDIAKNGLLKNSRDLLACGGGCSVGIVSFSETATRVCDPTESIDEIERRLAPLHTATTTAMHDGIREAVHMAMMAPAGAEREVVLVTDGLPDSSDKAKDAARFAHSNGVKLSILGVGHADVDENFLNQLGPTLVVEMHQMGDGIASLLSLSNAPAMSGAMQNVTGGLAEGAGTWK